jgi:predicted nucleic acid-binding Zn ribbon protein
MDEKEIKGSPVLHIGRILPDVIRTCRREDDVAMTGIWDIWGHTVGAAVAENTQPAAFKGRLLLVHVASSVWLHQLQFRKQELIEKINAACGRQLVEDISFKIGPLDHESGPEE